MRLMIGLAVLAATLALTGSGSAFSPGRITVAGVIFVQTRPELRSFQPYAGLQDQNVPIVPPLPRYTTRPAVIMPTPLPPVIHHGAPRPYSDQWYV